MLQREGIHMNLKKLRRIYAEEKLQVRRRGGRKRALGTRRPMEVPDGPNQRWSLDLNLFSAYYRLSSIARFFVSGQQFGPTRTG